MLNNSSITLLILCSTQSNLASILYGSPWKNWYGLPVLIIVRAGFNNDIHNSIFLVLSIIIIIYYKSLDNNVIVSSKCQSIHGQYKAIALFLFHLLSLLLNTLISYKQYSRYFLILFILFFLQLLLRAIVIIIILKLLLRV